MSQDILYKNEKFNLVQLFLDGSEKDQKSNILLSTTEIFTHHHILNFSFVCIHLFQSKTRYTREGREEERRGGGAKGRKLAKVCITVQTFGNRPNLG